MFRLYEETRHAPPPHWGTAVDGLGVPEEIWSALHRKARVDAAPVAASTEGETFHGRYDQGSKEVEDRLARPAQETQL